MLNRAAATNASTRSLATAHLLRPGESGALSERESMRQSRHRRVNHGPARVFLQTMIALASESLGLVAALAWNDAFSATLEQLGLDKSLAGLYTYAILATVLAVVVLSVLGRIAARVGGEPITTPESR